MDGFFKIAQNGGTYVVATFYNPDTNEIKTQCVRDYDYADASRDNDELYYMDIDEEVRRKYLRFKGIIQVGDTVEVFKGRKVPIGTVAEVKEIKPYYDHYHRHIADYAYFTDGQRTNIDNCKLIKEG